MKPAVVARCAFFLMVCVLAGVTGVAPAQNQRPPQTQPAAPYNPQAKARPQPRLAANTPPTGGPVAIPRPVAPQAPFPPLSAEEQQHLDRILGYWERRSGEVQRYRCKFKRWEYDSVFGPKGERDFKTYSLGRIMYSAPDKGLFKVEEVRLFTPPAKPGEAPQYLPREDAGGEHWVCDGKSIFEFDPRKKQLIQRELPPDLRGQAIVDGPLPFMFGAKADKLKLRYWLRAITPPNVNDRYYLEAFPKTAEDAANYQKLWVVLDQKEFLPQVLQIFDRGYNERTGNFTRTVFEFESREVNWSMLPDMLTPFHKEFFAPETPKGWQKVVLRHDAPPGQTNDPPGTNAPAAANSGTGKRSFLPQLFNKK